MWVNAKIKKILGATEMGIEIPMKAHAAVPCFNSLCPE